MAENIVIRMPVEPAAEVEWIFTDSAGARHGLPMRGSLRAAADAAGDRQVLVLLPAVDILITTADVPLKGARLLQAIPFALEEQLAEDVENLHFAAGARRPNGHTPVVIIQRKKFEDYLERLHEVGLSAAGVFAEIQGLARIPGTISMLIDGDNIIINDGADVELALQQISPGDALAAIGALDDDDGSDSEGGDDEILGATPHLPTHVLVYLDGDDNERYENEWLALRNELESLDTRLLADGALPRLAATVSTGKAINMLQGEFAIRTGFAAAWKPWRNVALLLCAVGAVGLVTKVADYFSLKRQDQRLQIAVEEQFRQTFPWVSTVRNPQAQLQAELNRIGASDPAIAATDFLEILVALSGAMKTSPEANINGISFRSGVTDIRLDAPNVSALEKIENSVRESQDLDASIERAEKKDKGVKGHIQIKVIGP